MKLVSPSHFLKAGLSLNCLNSSVWSASSSTMHPLESLVVLDAGVLLVRVFHGVLVGLVCSHLCWESPLR